MIKLNHVYHFKSPDGSIDEIVVITDLDSKRFFATALHDNLGGTLMNYVDYGIHHIEHFKITHMGTAEDFPEFFI